MAQMLRLPEYHRNRARENRERILALNLFPAATDVDALLERAVPLPDSTSTGLNPVLACALDLVPREFQRVCMGLEVNDREAIQDARRSLPLVADSALCWWLALQSIVYTQNVGHLEFVSQISVAESFSDPEQRMATAQKSSLYRVFNTVRSRFGGVAVLELVYHDDIPRLVRMAFIFEGVDLVVVRLRTQQNQLIHDLHTHHPSLGLESVLWNSGRTDTLAQGPNVARLENFVDLGWAVQTATLHLARVRK